MQDLFHLNENIRQYDTVIIYGAAEAGQQMLFRLLQHNIKVYCFADADAGKCGARVLNIPVIHIDELDGFKETAAVVVLSGYALSVGQELSRRGYKHLFYDPGNEGGLIHLEREDSHERLSL